MTIKALSCAAATAVAIATAALTACTTEQYDAGDGKYSYLRSDFAEVTTDGQARMSSFVTDESQTWHVAGTPRVSWMTKSDTTYRALVYYATPSPQQHRGTAAEPVKVYSARSVLCPDIKSWHIGTSLKTDPVTPVALWLSSNRKYLNMSFDLKTGNSGSETEGQSIGAVLTEMTRNADGTLTAHITFCHDQANVPQYYSVRQYASLAVAQMHDADSAAIKINSYNGKVVKTICLK